MAQYHSLKEYEALRTRLEEVKGEKDKAVELIKDVVKGYQEAEKKGADHRYTKIYLDAQDFLAGVSKWKEEHD